MSAFGLGNYVPVCEKCSTPRERGLREPGVVKENHKASNQHDEIIVSEGNVVPGKGFSNWLHFCLCRDGFWVLTAVDKNTSIAS